MKMAGRRRRPAVAGGAAAGASAASACFPRPGLEKDVENGQGGQAGQAVDPEQGAVVPHGQVAAQHRPDGHAQVGRQAVEGEAAGADRRRAFPGHRRGVPGQQRLGEDPLQESRRQDPRRRGDVAHGDEVQPAQEQAQPLHGGGAQPVAEHAAQVGADQGADAEDADRLPRLGQGEAQLPCQVQGEEKKDHRAAAVDELDQRQQPGVARQPRVCLAV